MNTAYQKSAISMYNVTSTSVGANGIIPYTVKDVDTGISLTCDLSGIVTIKKSGLYLVEYVGTISVSTSSSSTTSAVQLNANGVLVNGTNVQNTTTSVGSKNLSFSKVIKVTPTMANTNVILSVVNPTTESEKFISSNLSVVKLA
jgi:hypothetical protein